MPNSTIIELSREKSTQQQALNSEWSNNMNEILNLPAGSVVQLKQAFIDEGAPFPDEAIELEEDVDISMGFVYWLADQNKATPTYNGIAAGDQGKGGLFLACKYYNATGLGDTLDGNKSFVVPKGIYSPDDLAELISNNLSNLTIHASLDNLTPWTYGVGNTLLQNTYNNNHIYEADSNSPGSATGALILININITPDLIAEFTAGKQVYIGYDDHGDWHPYQVYTITQTLSSQDPGKFEFHPVITDYQGKQGWKCYPVTTAHDYVGFYLAGDKASNKYFTYQSQNSWYGASQASLVYENNRFKFNYLHSPHFIDGNGTVGISIDNTNFELTTIAANSGIAFTALEPASFWRDTLGFNTDMMVKTMDEYENYTPVHGESVLQFGSNCTSALLGNFSLPAQTLADGMAVTNGTYYSTTSQTDAIIAVNANNGSSSQKESFYYIDINGLESSKLYNEVRTDLNINSVVSRYRSANGFITAYSEAGSQYVVQYPMKLSSFDVRILLSDYTPALTLGANSSIFIEVITPTLEEQEQMQKKKK